MDQIALQKPSSELMQAISGARKVTPNKLFAQIFGASHKVSLPEVSSRLEKVRLLALDPGETTGIAFFNGRLNPAQITLMQLDTKDPGRAFMDLWNIIAELKPTHIRCEDYRIYEWKASDHKWSPVHTLRWIGAISALAGCLGIPISFQMAQKAKQFWTDEKLKATDCYPIGMRHARDAVRHALYCIVFGA